MVLGQAMGLTRRLITLMVLLSGLVDLPRTLKLGPISGLAVLTIGYATVPWLLLLAQGRFTRTASSVMAPFLLLVAWGVWTFTWSGNNLVVQAGLQNLLVIVAMVGLILLAARESSRAPGLPADVGTFLQCATLVAAALYGGSVLVTGLGSGVVIGPRPFALFAPIGLAWNLAGWRYGSRSAMWVAVGLVVLIALSLSRLGLVVGLALFPLARIGSRRPAQWMRALVWTVIVAGVLAVVTNHVEPIRARFFEGDLSISAGGVAINASGRREMWEATFASFRESPWIGKGAGTAQLVAETAVPGAAHPHSDYLRILHDYGIFGMVLWLFGVGRLLLTTWRAWVRADENGDSAARVHLAALLATIALSAAMTTDNAVVYIFVMAPFAILAGASLGRPSPRRLLSVAPRTPSLPVAEPLPARTGR